MHVRLPEPELQQLHVTNLPAITPHNKPWRSPGDRRCRRGADVSVVPGGVVVELVQQPVSQHGPVLVYEDFFTAVDADQQADDVRRPVFGAYFI